MSRSRHRKVEAVDTVHHRHVEGSGGRQSRVAGYRRRFSERDRRGASFSNVTWTCSVTSIRRRIPFAVAGRADLRSRHRDVYPPSTR
jgi:hypothetical protein